MIELAPDLRAPFPWFGGKSRIAPLAWSRFGNVPNYVEPFFGSGAVLLGRPHEPGIETINDLDGYVANFWRALQAEPAEVAKWADWPVNENDLHARHIWLVNQKADLQARLECDPDYFDAKIAGYWVWGVACWIGSGFCSGKGPWHSVDGKLVHLGDAGRGVNRQLVHLGSAGQGVNRQREYDLMDYMQGLADRLNRVRVCCGDWSRVCGPTPTFKQGLTGVFLDPPYSHNVRDDGLYTVETDCSTAVREWAIANGDNPLMRIGLCGYEGEHDMPESWECVAWKANGGYASQGDGSNVNAGLERIWFSPNCLKAMRIQGVMEL